MIDLTGVEHHPAITDMVAVLCNKTQNTDTGFFKVEAAYFLGKMASNMRATIVTKDRGDIPVNIYALALATSGYGKGYSIAIAEGEFLKPFQRRFQQDTFPLLAEQHLFNLAQERSIRNGTDHAQEIEKATKEFRLAGAFPFTFDSGTTPAVKQLRHKLLLGGSGSINLQIDEIGSNLIGQTEVLTTFLELYDQGMVKQKLVKSTVDNERNEELDGKTPANMLLFGTPSKLFDGGQTEDQFYSFLDIGYARRCLFGMGAPSKKDQESLTPEELYQRLSNPTNNQAINVWATHFHNLADPTMFGWRMQVEDEVGIQLLAYKMACEREAERLPEYDEIRKAELSHRYFKALKLAGAYAFVDKSNEVEMEHLLSAILLVEESGAAFQQILTREKTYVKLAKYIADSGVELTHADLYEALPFYGGGNQKRNEMMNLATAWGYKKNIIIKKTFADGIELFKGEKLKETNLDEMIVSYSENFAYHYVSEPAPFADLHRLTQCDGLHWANHKFRDGHRAEEKVIPGFNMIVIDVDGGVSINTVHELMKEYKFLTYTTKRHTAENHRFRLILPMSHHLEMDSDEYKEFMNNVMQWLPFPTDESANQRAKKWESYGGPEDNPGVFTYNMEGELLDILPFIPKTSRNESYRNETKELASLDNLERWFAQRMVSGNRNNHMIKFALALVDSGMPLVQVSKAVHAFNAKLSQPLPEDELDSTIMVTVGKKLQGQ